MVKKPVAIAKKRGIVTGVLTFEENIFEGYTIDPQLAQIEDLLPDTQLN